jgi:hypothetical protein
MTIDIITGVVQLDQVGPCFSVPPVSDEPIGRPAESSVTAKYLRRKEKTYSGKKGKIIIPTAAKPHCVENSALYVKEPV